MYLSWLEVDTVRTQGLEEERPKIINLSEE